MKSHTREQLAESMVSHKCVLKKFYIHGYVTEQSLLRSDWLVNRQPCDGLNVVRTFRGPVEGYSWLLRDVGTVLSHVEHYRVFSCSQIAPCFESIRTNRISVERVVLRLFGRIAYERLCEFYTLSAGGGSYVVYIRFIVQ